MAFKSLFIAHAPNADSNEHKSIIDTGKYRLVSCLVSTQEEAIKTAIETHAVENLDAILLCPGFTSENVAELYKALNGEVGVSVARSDGPSSKVVMNAFMREGFF